MSQSTMTNQQQIDAINALKQQTWLITYNNVLAKEGKNAAELWARTWPLALIPPGVQMVTTTSNDPGVVPYSGANDASTAGYVTGTYTGMGTNSENLVAEESKNNLLLYGGIGLVLAVMLYGLYYARTH